MKNLFKEDIKGISVETFEKIQMVLCSLMDTRYQVKYYLDSHQFGTTLPEDDAIVLNKLCIALDDLINNLQEL